MTQRSVSEDVEFVSRCCNGRSTRRCFRMNKMSLELKNICVSMGFEIETDTKTDYFIASDKDWIEAVRILEVLCEG